MDLSKLLNGDERAAVAAIDDAYEKVRFAFKGSKRLASVTSEEMATLVAFSTIRDAVLARAARRFCEVEGV